MLILLNTSCRDRYINAACVNKLWRRVALKADVPILDLRDSGLFRHRFAQFVSAPIGQYADSYTSAQRRTGEFFKQCPLRIRPKRVLGVIVSSVDLAVLDALAAFMPRIRLIVVSEL